MRSEEGGLLDLKKTDNPNEKTLNEINDILSSLYVFGYIDEDDALSQLDDIFKSRFNQP